MTKREQFVKYLLDNNWIIFEADETKKLWDWIEKTLIPNDPLLDENMHERVVKPTLAELNRYTNRIVVVDHRQGSSDYGRTIDAWHVKLEFDWQDYGKTLKIFINDK